MQNQSTWILNTRLLFPLAFKFPIGISPDLFFFFSSFYIFHNLLITLANIWIDAEAESNQTHCSAL